MGIGGQNNLYAKKKSRILFILDCSLSMDNNLGEKKRMDVAKALLIHLVDSLSKKGVELAFRAYGHRSPTVKQDCRDTRLEVGFEPENADKIIQVIKKLQPKGTTPIAYSLIQSGLDFPDKKAQNIIILITDGAEECKGNPCEASRILQDQGVILKPFIIGIALTPEIAHQFECVGTTFNSTNPEDFNNIFKKVINQALDETTAQLYLNANPSIGQSKPINSLNDFVFSVDDGDPNSKTYYVQTTNSAGVPDTFKIAGGKSVKITPFYPPNDSKINILTQLGKNNVINYNLEGLSIKISNKLKQNGNFLVGRCASDGNVKSVNMTSINENLFYGSFCKRLYLLSIPFQYQFPNELFNKVIKDPNSGLNEVSLISPNMGMAQLTFAEGVYFEVLKVNNEEKTSVIYRGKSSAKAIESINLLEGNYKLIYKPESSYKTLDSKVITFNIQPNKPTILNNLK